MGDGFCAQCGARLGTTMAPPPVPIGTRVSGYEVTGARAEDLLAQSPAGEHVLLAFGSESLLALEAAALRALASSHVVPRPIELGHDATYGTFLALSFDRSLHPLVEARALPIASVVVLARQLVDLVAAVDAAGCVWGPLPHDFHLTSGGAVALSRVRCAARSSAVSPVDVRTAFEAAGGAFLPRPGAFGPTRFVRLLSARAPGGAGEALGVGRAREELALAEAELATLPRETVAGTSELTDPGLCRDRNEDAAAVAGGEIRGEKWAVLVVCDGVSTSAQAASASAIAAKTTRDALAHFARSGDIRHERGDVAMSAAIRAAHVAVCATPMDRRRLEPADPPGTTLVAALVFRRRLVVGWAGDSRAYWISPNGAELLTRDHSWATEAVLRGEMTEAQAMAAPLAHALTKCLGPLELEGPSQLRGRYDEVTPDVCVRDLRGPGHLVLCTDGLWNYFPSAPELASVVRAAGVGASTALIARCLVNHALARGGGDNVSVAVHKVDQSS
jgi:serine/threonine protein phosphatase PrpC